MSAFSSKASIPRFQPLMKYSEKLFTYHTLFLLGVLAVLLFMLNTAQAATLDDPLEAINRPIMHFNIAIDTVLFKPLGKT